MVVIGACLLGLAACTGASRPDRDTAGRTVQDEAQGTGVTVSGYATFGYVKGH